VTKYLLRLLLAAHYCRKKLRIAKASFSLIPRQHGKVRCFREITKLFE
jgi:hypothetical protein